MRFHYIQRLQLLCAQVDRGGILGTSAMHTATVAKSLAVPFASPVTISDSDLIWFYCLEISGDYTLLGTNIFPTKALLNMIFPFPRWDMLIPWSVDFGYFWVLGFPSDFFR